MHQAVDLRATRALQPPLSFKAAAVRPVFSFDQGLAAPETFPVEDLLRISREVVEQGGREVFDYFDPEIGYEELSYGARLLRERLAMRIKAIQGRDVGPDGVLLTCGSVQGIALAVAAYIEPGDIAVTEAATFRYAYRFMETAGGDMRTLPVDADGLDTDALEDLLQAATREGRRVKMVYTIPTFQLPTGSEMSLRRRRHLVELAQRHHFLVLEDDVYGELRFAGERLPSLLELDDSGLVLQCSSFSKTIAPALRLGWVAGTPGAINALVAVRQDLGVSQWLARTMAAFMAQDLLDPHLQKVREVYREKAMIAVAALRAYCGDYATFRVPNGSFYLWVEIDDRVNWAQAAQAAAQEGIVIRPGERFMGDTDGRTYFRLAYSHVSGDVIREGIGKLGQILTRCAR